MFEIGILGLLLLLVCHVDQQIEAMRVQIAGYNSQELLFVKEQQGLYSFAKRVQKAALLLANGHPGFGFRRRLFNLHTQLAQASSWISSNQFANVRSLTNSADFRKISSGPAYKFIHQALVFLAVPNEFHVFASDSHWTVKLCAMWKGA